MEDETAAETPAANPLVDDPADETVELLGQEEGDAEEQPAQSPEEGKTEQPKTAVKAEGHRSAQLQKLIDEAGSEEAFFERIHKSWHGSKELAQQLDKLTAEITTLKAGKDTKSDTTEESDPDISSLNDQRALVAEELEGLDGEKQEMVAEFNRLQNELIRAETRLELADDIDKEKFQDKVNTLKAQTARLSGAWKNLPLREKRLKVQLGTLDKQLGLAKSNIQSRVKAQKQQQEKDELYQAEFRNQVNALIEQASREAGFTAGSKVADRHAAYVCRSIETHLNRMDPEGAGIDPVLAVKFYSDEFLEGLQEGSKLSFQKATQQKTSAVSPPAAKSPAAGAKKTVAAKDLTKDQIERHHKAIFG